MDDYYNTMSGAKVRMTEAEKEALVDRSLQLPAINTGEDLINAWDQLVVQSKLLPTKVKQLDFEGVLDIVSSPLYKGLSAACRSNREATTAPRACREPPLPMPEVCQKELKQLRIRVLDLDSFAFLNRVFYFNLTDKKQLAQLTKDTGALEDVDISEPLEMADDIINIASRISKDLKSALLKKA